MYLDIYIADLEGFDWDTGHPPRRQRSFMPGGNQLFFRIVELIEKGELKGKQVDWGAWVAVMKKEEIIDMTAAHLENYGKRWQELSPENTGNKEIEAVVKQHKFQVNLFLQEIENLDPNKEYGVVCSEL